MILRGVGAFIGTDHPGRGIGGNALASASPISSPRLPALQSAIRRVSERQLLERLIDLEAKGWLLRAPVERIWLGDRDLAALTAGLDGQDTMLIAQVLTLIAETDDGAGSVPSSPHHAPISRALVLPNALQNVLHQAQQRAHGARQHRDPQHCRRMATDLRRLAQQMGATAAPGSVWAEGARLLQELATDLDGDAA